MAKMFSDKAQKVLEFLQQNPTVQLTTKELAAAIGMPPRSVNGVVTSLVGRGLAERVPATVAGLEVKYVQLTPSGKDIDPTADASE